jgi:hypothetical protein
MILRLGLATIILSVLIGYGFTSLVAGHTHAATDLTLGRAVDASSDISNLVSSNKPLQYGVPIEFKLFGSHYTMRMMYYNNTKAPQMLFREALETMGQLDTKFEVSKNTANTIYIKSDDAAHERGISYIFSLNADKGLPKDMPTTRAVLSKLGIINEYRPSPLTYPGDPRSMVTIAGKEYQIRYFIFQQNGQDGKATFGKMVQQENLRDLEATPRDDGYGELLTFMASDELKKKGIRFVLSLGRVG